MSYADLHVTGDTDADTEMTQVLGRSRRIYTRYRDQAFGFGPLELERFREAVLRARVL